MNVSVKMNLNALRKLADAQIKALGLTAQQILDEERDLQFMPLDTANMQDDSTEVDISNIAIGKVSIVTNTPYAARIYFNPDNFNIHTDKNMNAHQEWWEDWISGSEQLRSFELYKEFFRANAGGYVK